MVEPADRLVMNCKKTKIHDRVNALRERRGLITILEPGIPDIVQNELYCKWRPFVEDEYIKAMCPYPGKDVIKRLKEAKNKKAALKREAKKKLLDKTNGTKKKSSHKNNTKT